MCCETVVHGEDDGVATRLFGGIYDGWNPPYSPSVNLICGNYKSLGNPHKKQFVHWDGIGVVCGFWSLIQTVLEQLLQTRSILHVHRDFSNFQGQGFYH